DNELNQYLLSLALEEAALVPKAGAAAIEGSALEELANSYLTSEAIIRRLADFVDGEALHALIAHDITLDLSDEPAAMESAARLRAVLSGKLQVEAGFDERTEHWSLRLARMRHGNLRVSHIDEEFLVSGDYAQLRKTASLLSGLVGPDAVIRRGEKSQQVSSFAAAMQWLFADVERNLSKQRYKGLGEMNPEQLWETTMDPSARRLLKVRIEDAIAADEIFTTLMGDVVEPRRRFIEENALYARNIDV
ncbi:MAG: DNA gyrase subunit B, partial [Rhodocyclaceae bacterium]